MNCSHQTTPVNNEDRDDRSISDCLIRRVGDTNLDEIARFVATSAGIVSYTALQDVGVSPSMLARAVKSGLLIRPRYGLYAGASQWAQLEVEQQHGLLVQAAARRYPQSVFSHRSAAVIYQIPLLGPWDHPAQVLTTTRTGSRSRHNLLRRQGPIDPNQCVINGLRVTSVCRTVADLACTEPFASGLMAADHALRARMTTRARLEHMIRSMQSRRGVRRARIVAAHTNPLSESPGESLSRGRIIELGYEVPQLQVPLRAHDGRIYRVDFYWEKQRLIGEFDGKLKYTGKIDGDLRDPGDVAFDEKRREDALRRAGFAMVRWSWNDALHASPLDEMLADAGAPRA